MLDELIKEPFLGFDPKAIKFLKSLKNPKNNNKGWFHKHSDTYENYIKKPVRDLIDTLAIEIKKIDPEIVVNYRSIFRINRDVRFSKNKHPYKTHVGFSFCFDTVKSAEIPQFYYHFSPDDGFLFAGGQYSTDPAKLKKIRTAISEDFGTYSSIIKSKKFKKEYKEIHGVSISRLPKGYEHLNKEDTDPKLVETLMMKQFYIEKYYNIETIYSNKIVDVVTENIQCSYDFIKFLYEASK